MAASFHAPCHSLFVSMHPVCFQLATAAARSLALLSHFRRELRRFGKIAFACLSQPRTLLVLSTKGTLRGLSAIRLFGHHFRCKLYRNACCSLVQRNELRLLSLETFIFQRKYEVGTGRCFVSTRLFFVSM